MMSGRNYGDEVEYTAKWNDPIMEKMFEVLLRQQQEMVSKEMSSEDLERLKQQINMKIIQEILQ